MPQDNISTPRSSELSIPIPESECQDFFKVLSEYISDIGEISLLSDKLTPALPNEISDIISQISSNAKVLFPWQFLRPALMIKLKEVLSDFPPVSEDKHEEERNSYKNIDNLLLQRFKNAPPFTLQRVCDLLTEPKKYYKMKIKFIRAVEKVLTVISYAKVHYQSPPLASNCSEPKFSPPPKRLKQEVSNASAIIVSTDSNLSGKSNSGQLTHSFIEEKSKSDVNDEIYNKTGSDKIENGQYLEHKRRNFWKRP